MTDPSGPTPEQEAVRRLLADARHEGPPPAEVVSRLDDVLASLVADRTADRTDDRADDRAAVVDLGPRRRRLAGIGVLAAAAVVVAGVALGQALPRGADDSAGGESATQSQPDLSSSFDGGDGGSESRDDGADAGSGSAELAPDSAKSSATTPSSGRPALSSQDPRLDLRVLELRASAATRSQGLGSVDAAAGCDLPGLGGGRRLLVRVDEEPGIVVYRRPDGSTQRADVYVCGGSDAARTPVRTLTLPAP